VDGQQRLATTAIFLSAVRDYLRLLEGELAQSISDEFLTIFVRTTRARVPRLQLNLDDNEYFRARLSESTPAPTRLSHHLLNDAFIEAEKYVRAIVAGHDRAEHGNVLNRWVDFIEARSFVILLHVPNASNERMVSGFMEAGRQLG
jgi:hypothetical protein